MGETSDRIVPIDVGEVRLESATLDLVNLIAFAAHGRAFARRFRDATGVDLPAAELRTLLVLAQGDARSGGDLAAALAIDLGQASRQVSALERAGLVGRSADPADRRRSLVALSERGAEVDRRWRAAWLRDYLRPVARWPEADVADLTRWLRLVDAALRRGLGAGAPGGRRAAGVDAEPPHLRSYAEVVVGLVELVGTSHGFDDLLRELRAPIRQSAYFALRLIDAHGPLPITEVGQRAGVDQSQASKQVRVLEEHELVERATDGFDRRSTLVRASRRGRTLVRRVRDFQLAGLRDLLSGAPHGDRDRWAELVADLVAELSR
ncbi:DNA-binding transcriptional regulator, MarR family [Goodfellowiella coeruleoviolacea]|uniref:DNA-binding transcriptional regulator, MarR family n=1 Tax=Goodfellowiella coeruleoviolacea TaxID=334858 RepID=A0AAE3GKR5_9PSEU|nr:DNA-binding transcriptional regulator, MarR family [Goodfellowiella coeruleoviolacea]